MPKMSIITRKPIIMVDYDDTVVNTRKALCNYVNIPYNPKEYVNYDVLVEKFSSKNEFYKALYEVHKNYLHLEPIDEYVVETLDWLDDEFELHILTANNCNHLKLIQEWFTSYGLNLNIISVPSFEDKFSINWNILIDDHPKLLALASVNNRKVIQYPHYYNQGIKSINWKNIPEHIDRLLSK